MQDSSFRFLVAAYNHSIHKNRKKTIMESFDYMDWKGPIDVVNASVTLKCIEECRWLVWREHGLY